MDTINIELIVQASQMDENDIWIQAGLEILINGNKIYSESDIVNYEIMIESLYSNGEFFIFSCCCGITECSDWKKGIKVIHKEDKITWINGNSEQKWIFDKKEMLKNFNDIKTEAENFRKYFKSKSIHYVGFGYKKDSE